jgi:hypothetical protein
LRAVLATSVEVNDLEELAKWPHLAEVLHASALEEESRRAKEDADAWVFLAGMLAGGATRQAALREEEERHLRLKHEADLQAAAVEQREKGGGTAGTPV